MKCKTNFAAVTQKWASQWQRQRTKRCTENDKCFYSNSVALSASFWIHLSCL